MCVQVWYVQNLNEKNKYVMNNIIYKNKIKLIFNILFFLKFLLKFYYFYRIFLFLYDGCVKHFDSPVCMKCSE